MIDNYEQLIRFPPPSLRLPVCCALLLFGTYCRCKYPASPGFLTPARASCAVALVVFREALP